MSQTIQFRRLSQAAALAASVDVGEPVFCTDSGLLLIGDGSGKRLINAVISGLDASRPAAGIEGRWYLATDTQQLWRDSGSAWVAVLLGGTSDVRVLQNSVIMMAWDLALSSPLGDDVLIEDFSDESYIDAGASTYYYDESGDYCAPIAATTGNNTDADITSTSDVDRSDTDAMDVVSGSLTLVATLEADGSLNASTDYANAQMTSDNTPSPWVTSASSSAGSYLPWKGANRTAVDNTDKWESTTNPPQWWKIDCGSGNGKAINKYRVRAINGSPLYFPLAWTLLGSNNDSDYDTLDTVSGLSAPAAGEWSAWFDFTNSTEYRYYRIDITQTSDADHVGFSDICLVAAEESAPEGLFVAVSTTNLQIDTSGWSAITDIAATQTTPGSSALWHALSVNKGDSAETWLVYLSSTWREIVRNNATTWQYRDAAGSWQNATVNTRLGALEQAFAITENQMDATALAAIESAFASVFVAGTLDFAVGLEGDGANLPTLDKYTVTYSTPFEDLVLVLNSWEGSANDPDNAYALLKVKDNTGITLGTDLRAWVSIDDGSNWEELSGLAIIESVGDYDFVSGSVEGITPRSDRTIVLKIQAYNESDVEIHDAAIGVEYE